FGLLYSRPLLYLKSTVLNLIPHKKAQKKPVQMDGLQWYGRRPTLPGVTPVPSARQGLTSLFGMGRGGAPALGRPMFLSIRYLVSSTGYKVLCLESQVSSLVSILNCLARITTEHFCSKFSGN